MLPKYSKLISKLLIWIKNNRNVSGVGTDPDKKGSPDIYNKDGSIITGHIPNWRKLTQHDRDIVMNERKRRRTTGGKGGKGGKANKRLVVKPPGKLLAGPAATQAAAAAKPRYAGYGDDDVGGLD